MNIGFVPTIDSRVSPTMTTILENENNGNRIDVNKLVFAIKHLGVKVKPQTEI